MTSPLAAGRLAPSPTGALHLGNARSFLVVWLSARAQGARLVMRMEDLDHPKVKPGAAELAYEDLRWLGLDWDEGPDVGGPHAPYVQSLRVERYLQALARLRAAGLIYPCICTRRDVEEAQTAPHAGEELRYPGTCRGRFSDAREAESASGRPPAWRFRVAPGISTYEDGMRGHEECELEQVSGDFVVARGDTLPAYQLAVVVDDSDMQITEVIRADDLVPSTHRQLALMQALELQPPAFTHVPLVIGPDGRRLAKRHGDSRIATLRQEGAAPEHIVGWLASTLGWAGADEQLMPAELISRFDLARVPRAPLVFDAAAHHDFGRHSL